MELARERLLRVTSKLLLMAWVPIMLFSALSVWDRPAVRSVVLLTAATIAAAGLIVLRPSRKYARLQAYAFLAMLVVGIPAAGGVAGITPGGMATAAVLVAWAALFFGVRGLWGMLAVFTVVLTFTAWQFVSGHDVAPPAPNLTDVGYWVRKILLLLSTFLLSGLVLRAAISAYEEALAAEREARTEAAREEAARLVAESEALVLQRREAASALAAGLAHDIANVLQVSTMHAELLRGSLSDAAPRESVDQILRSAERGTLMVRELLALGRSSPASADQFDGSALIPRLQHMLRGIVPPKVRYTFRAEEQVRLRGDALRFEQVVINLAMNACHAMPQGGTLDVSLARAGDGFARLEVRDSGVGILPELQERIFQPFFTTKAAGDGSGLGLSMVARIVAEVGGRVAVESTAGQGSTFSVEWPMVPAAPAPRASVHS